MNVRKVSSSEIKVASSFQNITMITVKTDPGRSLSSLDYAIESEGREYPCLGISENEDDFSISKEEISNDGTQNNIFFMIFEDDGSPIENKILKFKLFGTGLTNTRLELFSTKSAVLATEIMASPVSAKAMVSSNTSQKVLPVNHTQKDDTEQGVKKLSNEEIKRFNQELSAFVQATREQNKTNEAPTPNQHQKIDNGVKGKELLNVNKASREELLSLPGIGKGTVDKIIEGRPYKSIEELLKIKGVRPSNYKLFAPHLKAE